MAQAPVKAWDAAPPTKAWDAAAPVKAWDEPKTKDSSDYLNELAQMGVGERAWKLVSGAVPGIAEAALQMGAQTPAMVAQVLGSIKALKEGDTTEEGYKKHIKEMTPAWAEHLASNEVVNPQTYAGNLISQALGDAFKYGGKATAVPGAFLRATVESTQGNYNDWVKNFQKHYDEIAPTMEQVTNAAVLGKMGVEGVKKAFPTPEFIDESGRAMSPAEVEQAKRRKAMQDSLLGNENDPNFVGPKDFVGPPEGPPQPGSLDFMGPVDTDFVGPKQDYGLPMKMRKLPKGEERFPAISEKMPTDTLPSPEPDLGLPPIDPNRTGILGWDDDGGYRPLATPDGLPDQQARATEAIDNQAPIEPLNLRGDGVGPYPTAPVGESNLGASPRFREDFPAREVDPSLSPRSFPKIDKEFKVKAWDGPVQETPLPTIQTDVENGGLGTHFGADAKATLRLADAHTVGEAVDVVREHGTPEEKLLADHIKSRSASNDMPMRTDFEHDSVASIREMSNGTQEMVINPKKKGNSALAILHEATHAATNDALFAYMSGKGTPHQMAYGAELGRLFDRVLDEHAAGKTPDLNENWIRNLLEFNAYGLTHPTFSKILKSIPYGKETVWDRVKMAVKNMLGIDTPKAESVFDRMMALTDQWQDIKTKTDGARAGAVLEAAMKAKVRKEVLATNVEFDKDKYENWKRITGEFIGRPGDVLHNGKYEMVVRQISADQHGNIFVDAFDPMMEGIMRFPADYFDEVKRLFKGKTVDMEGLAQLAVKRIAQNLKDFNYPEEAGKPKYDLTPADKGWTNIFTDGMGLKGPGKNQAGYIDLGPMFKWVKGALGLSNEAMLNFKRKLAAHSQEFRDPTEVRQWLEVARENMKDLFGTKNSEYAGMFNTQNQMVQRMVDNPVVRFVFNYMQESARQAEKRMYGYHLQVMNAKKWATRNTKESVDFFREWIALNAKPEMRELAAQLETDPAKMTEYFISKGVSETAVKALMPYMKVFKDVRRADSESLASMGRKLEDQPLYFPLGRHGPYHITVWDENGDVRWSYAHATLADARKNMADIEAQMPAGWKTSNVVRTDPTRIINSAMMEALLGNAPQWLHDIAVTSMSKQMEYVRNFEKGRSDKYEIRGYVGELKPETNSQYQAQLKDILDALSQRFRESYHLEQASAAIRIGNELLMDPSVLSDHFPNTHRWVNNMVARQIGIDLGGGKQGGIFQDALKGIGHVLTKMDSIYEGYTPKKGDNIVPDTAFKALVKTLNYTASLMKIGLNPNVLAGNFIQNAFIMLDGMRSAGRIGVNPMIAVAAQIEQLAYVATLGTLERHAGVRDFMRNAKAEGVIDPHGREDFSITDARERTRSLGPVDSIVQGPRDAIERFTNYNSALYYKIFMDKVKAAHPDMDMSDLNFKQTVYNLTHSFTGDYSPMANLFAFEKAGAKGAILSNFAKWKFNRIGRYLDDSAMVLNVDKYGPSAVLPLAMTVVMGLAMAGVQGAVGVVEYEAARQWMDKLFGWKMKPMAAIISDYAPQFRDSWMNRGMVTGLSDWTAQQFGEKSGPDFSGSMRDSSVLEISTVLPGTLADVGTAAYNEIVKRPMSKPEMQKRFDSMFDHGMAGDVWKYMKDYHFTGITHQDTENTLKALPVVAQEATRQLVFGIPQPRGENSVTQDKRKNVGNYVRDPFQENLAFFGGTKTTDERKHDDAVSYYRYMDHMNQQNKIALKNSLTQGLEDQNQEVVNYAFRKLAENHGAQAAQSEAQTALMEYMLKSRLDFFEGKQIQVSRMQDPTAKINAMKMLDKAMAVQKGITPDVPKTPPVKAWQ